jgi:hypothetical protein
MELKLPDWPRMHILKGVSNGRINEVPNLNALITTTCDKMTSSWMEINSTDPVFVAFTRHNVLFILNVVDLPGAIVTASCYDLLLGVQSHTTDSSWATVMCLDLLIQ